MSVGASLARARDELGLSVEDVSAATRIRGGLIRAIEADDFAPCGGAVYARGHIRSIARVVEIDPEPLIAEYDRTHVEEPVPIPVPNQPVEPDLAARADRRRPNWTAAMIVALVAIIGLAAVGLYNGNSPKHPSAAASDIPSGGPVASSTPTTSAPVSPPPSAVAVVPTKDAVAMVRVTGDKTWLQVETLDGRVLFSALLGHGQSKVFRDARGLRLVIGNAPAVQFVADNQDFGVPHSQGNVAHVLVRPAGDVQFN